MRTTLPNHLFQLLSFLVFLLGSRVMTAAEPASHVVEAEKIAQAHDLVKACEYLAGLPDPVVSANAFHTLLKRSWKAKNVAAMIQYGQAGVQFALQASAKCDDAKLAVQLRGLAKSIAYDTSSNLWPGWNEPGVKLNPTDLAIGLQLAKTNLRLAKELDRKGDPLGHAWWLLGAHELASHNYSSSVKAFEAAHSEYSGENALMARSYSYLAQHFTRKDAELADVKQDFEQSVKLLRESTGPDGKFFADQLETAVKIFLQEAVPHQTFPD